jgi:LacI family transcriptional regulator
MEMRTFKTRRDHTIAEIARESGLGTATVDRVLNDRNNVRDATRRRVLAAMTRLRADATHVAVRARYKVCFLSDSGIGTTKLEEAVTRYASSNNAVECAFVSTAASARPGGLADLIERTADSAEGLIVVARDDPIINRTIRSLTGRRVPVICVLTDLPTSGRTAYVGSDEAGAGATAAYLMGQIAGSGPGAILLVCGASCRSHEERELGFRRVLRSECANLAIDEQVGSSDDAAATYRAITKYLYDRGPPAGIYNVAGGNLGVGRALADAGLAGKVHFIGHALNTDSCMLLETGIMNFVIDHDLDAEVSRAVAFLVEVLEKKAPPPPPLSSLQIYTKYSCGWIGNTPSPWIKAVSSSDRWPPRRA